MKTPVTERTEVLIERWKERIRKTDSLLSMGSCFSSEMSGRMQQEGFRICSNPFGVLYNPVSIAQSFALLESERPFCREDVILRNTNPPPRNSKAAAADPCHRPIAPCEGGYTSFYHHGSFTRKTPEEFLENANRELEHARNAYRESGWIVVTFGTAWTFRHLGKDMIVSNCHKHPASEFRRELLEAGQIAELYDKLLTSSDKKWIFTVSPIRHLKDGAHGNQISKSILLTAVDELCRRHTNVRYFPSYEIVLDELRDYRWYAADRVHPSEEASDYIFRRFSETALEQDTK